MVYSGNLNFVRFFFNCLKMNTSKIHPTLHPFKYCNINTDLDDFNAEMLHFVKKVLILSMVG